MSWNHIERTSIVSCQISGDHSSEISKSSGSKLLEITSIPGDRLLCNIRPIIWLKLCNWTNATKLDPPRQPPGSVAAVRKTTCSGVPTQKPSPLSDHMRNTQRVGASFTCIKDLEEGQKLGLGLESIRKSARNATQSTVSKRTLSKRTPLQGGQQIWSLPNCTCLSL